jgi:hypothetical protein
MPDRTPISSFITGQPLNRTTPNPLKFVFQAIKQFSKQVGIEKYEKSVTILNVRLESQLVK